MRRVDGSDTSLAGAGIASPLVSAPKPDPRLELLTVAEVATALGIGESTAYRLVGKSPNFPKAVKVGGQWRIPRVQLERFVLGDTDGAVTPS